MKKSVGKRAHCLTQWAPLVGQWAREGRGLPSGAGTWLRDGTGQRPLNSAGDPWKQLGTGWVRNTCKITGELGYSCPVTLQRLLWQSGAARLSPPENTPYLDHQYYLDAVAMTDPAPRNPRLHGPSFCYYSIIRKVRTCRRLNRWRGRPSRIFICIPSPLRDSKTFVIIYPPRPFLTMIMTFVAKDNTPIGFTIA